ncbi:hypothetical protein AMS68_006625 [Peltaster fructicola]|uniref:DNA polymerase n=1 Tax=Peltaster fructicola TaxID=286661 RepID=A0A6H0Y2N1_9PEZI|nr:hypothetical protein AMS68_006625 [Peltaster fructicola]
MSSISDPTNMRLDFSKFPPFFVSRTHLTDEELDTTESLLEGCGAAVTYNLVEARIVLSKVSRKTRLLFDLRTNGLLLEEIPNDAPTSRMVDQITPELDSKPAAVPILIEDSSTASEGEHDTSKVQPKKRARKAQPNIPEPGANLVRVLSLQWLHDSYQASETLPLDDYTTLLGRRARNRGTASDVQEQTASKAAPSMSGNKPLPPPLDTTILERAKEDAPTGFARPSKRRFGQPAPSTTLMPPHGRLDIRKQPAHLLHATTSEEDHGYSDDLPQPPEWALKGIKYACQRVTLAGNPNEQFISQLRKIKLARTLTSDEIGVRAYSTSIAALLAYPYKFSSPREILRLPGCDAKIANLFVEWSNTGKIKAVDDVEADRDLRILRQFYDIWGVGALTAREFYYDRGWQDLDDLVEYNWKGLSRVQQVGVKFFEEFLEKIPRAEVEHIGKVIHQHAVKVRDVDVQSIIVGGYRRGKEASGDVDVIVSHPDESKTLNIIADIVASLEEEGWITHTLLLSLNSTNREQQTLPFRSGNMHGGHGFDNLDKAFVVWQDIDWPTKEADLAASPNAKNSNIHRRVDIIIAPWRTVGCAVLGWSGGTTFQRDVRRYVKHRFGYKFDSSGVRDRSNGEVIDLEGFHRYEGKLGIGRAKTIVEAEKRVFEGLELEYKEPFERCTD